MYRELERGMERHVWEEVKNLTWIFESAWEEQNPPKGELDDVGRTGAGGGGSETETRRKKSFATRDGERCWTWRSPGGDSNRHGLVASEVSEIPCLGCLGRVCSVRWEGWHCSSSGWTAPSLPTRIWLRAGVRSDFHGRVAPDSPERRRAGGGNRGAGSPRPAGPTRRGGSDPNTVDATSERRWQA